MKQLKRVGVRVGGEKRKKILHNTRISSIILSEQVHLYENKFYIGMKMKLIGSPEKKSETINFSIKSCSRRHFIFLLLSF